MQRYPLHRVELRGSTPAGGSTSKSGAREGRVPGRVSGLQSSALGPEKVRIGLETPWRDGTTGVVSMDHELIEQLIALVPPPRGNLVHYEGVSEGTIDTDARTHQYDHPTGEKQQGSPQQPGVPGASTLFDPLGASPTLAPPPELAHRN